MASSDLLEAPRNPIEMKVFQGGGLPQGGGGSVGDLYVAPSQPIEMKVFQGGGGGHQEGGGVIEAGNLHRNIDAFLQTQYSQALLAKPPLEFQAGKTYSAGLIVVDFSGKVALAQRAGDAQAGLLGPGIGHIDPEDKTVEGLRPGMMAAIRETQEELGINALQPQYVVTKGGNVISQMAIKNLQKKQDRFILIYSNGGGEKQKGGMEIYYTVERKEVYPFTDNVTGPMPRFRDEVNTEYKFQEFKKKPEEVDVKGNTGVGFIGLNHCITVLEANKETIGKGDLTIKILNILKCIQDNHTTKDIEAAIQKYLNENFKNEYNAILGNLKKFGAPKKSVKFVEEGGALRKENGTGKGANKGGSGANKGGSGANEGGSGANKGGSGANEGGSGANEGGSGANKGSSGANEGGSGEDKSEKPESKEEKKPLKPNCAEGEMLLLSGLYRVPCVTNDIEQKERIQSLEFNSDEELFFKNELHFDHPFIRQYLQSEEVKEDWYEFWKLYVNYDASDKFTLLTWEEGKVIQRFRNRVWKAYQKYLLEGALTFLLKTKSPVALHQYLNPPESTPGFLFEAIEKKEEKKEEEDDEYEPGKALGDENENAEIVPEPVAKLKKRGKFWELEYNAEEAEKDLEETKKPLEAPPLEVLEGAEDEGVGEGEEETPGPKPETKEAAPVIPTFLDKLYWEGREEVERSKPEEERVPRPSLEELQGRFIDKVLSKLNTEEYKAHKEDMAFDYLKDLYGAIRVIRSRFIGYVFLRKFIKELMEIPNTSHKIFEIAKKKYAPNEVHSMIIGQPDISVKKILNIFFNINYAEFMKKDVDGDKGKYYRHIERAFLKFYNGLVIHDRIQEYLRDTEGEVEWPLEEEAAPAPALGGGALVKKNSRKKRITRHKNPKQKKRNSKRKSKISS